MSEPTVLGLLKEQIDGVRGDVDSLRTDFADHRKETEAGFREVLARLPAEPAAETPSSEGEIRISPARLTRTVRPWLVLLMELGKVAVGAGIGAAAMSGSDASEPPAVEQGP